MVYSCDRRYSEMSRREINILMNDRWALLCVFTVSVWRLLAVTCCYCCCSCSAVIFCLTGQSGAAWQDCYCVAEHWVKGEERFEDLRLFQRRTGRPLLHFSSIFDIYNLLKAACVVGNESMLILECKNTSNEAKSYWWRWHNSYCHHMWVCGSPVWQQHFSEDLDPLTDLRLFCPFYSRNLLDKDTFSKSDPCKYKPKAHLSRYGRIFIYL